MAKDVFGVEVVTPEQSLIAGSAKAVILRTSTGFLTVLNGHAPLIADVVPCDLRVEQEDGTNVHMAVHGGFVEVELGPGAAEGLVEDPEGPYPGLSSRVRVLANVAELASEIDVARAEAAKEQAAATLAERGGARGSGLPTTDIGEEESVDPEIRRASEALQRAELRLEVAGAPAT